MIESKVKSLAEGKFRPIFMNEKWNLHCEATFPECHACELVEKCPNWTEKEPPSCFGEFVCMDDCMCSCPFWEECKSESEDREDECEA